MKTFYTQFYLVLIIAILLGHAAPIKAENTQWDESRQFEQQLEEKFPDIMKFVWAAHISDKGLEVQVSMGFYPRTEIERESFYAKISDFWKNSEFVKAKKYSGRVQFMQLDKPLRTLN